MKESKKYYTSKEVQSMAGISSVTLRKFRNEGYIPYVRLTPRSFRYGKEDVEDFVRWYKSQRQRSTRE